MDLQNIGVSNSDDAFYRYKMPRMITKIEGRGNGIKTNIVNMVDIAKALTRPTSYTTKNFGCELGAQSKFDEWVFDCVNARILLPTEAYMVGRVPPPHISPFVNNEAEGYIPDYAKIIKRLQNVARSQVLPMPGSDLDDPQNLLKEGVIDRTEAIEAAEKKCKLKAFEKQYHYELKKELVGITYSAFFVKWEFASIR